MKPLLLLLLLPLSSLAQAPAVMPRPPAVRPVVNETYFPTPGATPAGTGLVVPDSTGGTQVVPRSPNKRVLPVTAEPGVWAADGAPQASVPPVPLFNVEVPMPSDATPGVRKVAAECAVDLTFGMVRMSEQRVTTFPRDARMCVTARALEYCTDTRKKERERRGMPFEDHAKIDAYVKALVAAWCTGKLRDDEASALERVKEGWDIVTNGKTP